MSENFKNLFDSHRRKVGMLQKSIAAQLNVHEETLSRWKNGKEAVPFHDLEQLCKILQLSNTEEGEFKQLAHEIRERLSSRTKTLTNRTSAHNSDLPKPLQIFTSLSEQRLAYYRQRAVKQVKAIWIDGVLSQSLFHAILIRLNLKERFDAVAHPWDMVMRGNDQGDRVLPAGTKIIEVFDEAGGSLLILGEPGSGKTTVLLDLARDMIERMESDPLHPIPVVLNLSTWTRERQALDDWLVNELIQKYNVPRKIGHQWVDDDHLLLLLDGLDEVERDYREQCVNEINQFRMKHPCAMAICSRVTDYGFLEKRLTMNNAVVLQPLTTNQIQDYLERADLREISNALQQDATLRELAQSPLLLSMMTLTYDAAIFYQSAMDHSIEGYRKRLFDAYIKMTLKRRFSVQSYPPQQTVFWLAWLAKMMTEHGQTEFFIERMQPSWLARKRDLFVYALWVTLMIGLCFGLFVGMANGLFNWAGGWLKESLFGNAMIGKADWWDWHNWRSHIIVTGLPFAFILSVISGVISILPDVTRLKHPFRQTVLNMICIGIVGGAGGALAGVINNRLFYHNNLAIVGALLLGLIHGVFAGIIVRPGKIEMTVRQNDWSKLKIGLSTGILCGIIGGISIGWIYSFIGQTGDSILTGLNMFVMCALLGIIPAITGEGNISEKVSSQRYVWQSVHSLIYLAITATFLALIGNAITHTVAYGVNVKYGVFPMLIVLVLDLLRWAANPLWFGITVMLFYGGISFVQHFVLRLLLAQSGSTPRLGSYTHFLDHAVDCILMHKVGSGYIFIHGFLLKHFAQMSEDEIEHF